MDETKALLKATENKKVIYFKKSEQNFLQQWSKRFLTKKKDEGFYAKHKISPKPYQPKHAQSHLNTK